MSAFSPFTSNVITDMYWWYNQYQTMRRVLWGGCNSHQWSWEGEARGLLGICSLEGTEGTKRWLSGVPPLLPRECLPYNSGHPLILGGTDMDCRIVVWWTGGRKSSPMAMPIHGARVAEGIQRVQDRGFLSTCTEKCPYLNNQYYCTSHSQRYQPADIFGFKSTIFFIIPIQG